MEENIVIQNNGRELAGTLCIPEAQSAKGAVLLLHGWVSHRDEVGRLYIELAKQLAEAGIISLRFDFYGCGQSHPEKLADMLISTMLNDAKSALNCLYDYVGESILIGICGFSLGTVIMAILLQETKLPIKSIVGLSPLMGLTKDFSYSHQILIQQLESVSDSNQVIEHDLGWRKISIKPKFIHEFPKIDQALKKGYESYRGNSLVIGGELDFSGDNVIHFDKFLSQVTRLKKEYLPGTDHIFNIFNPDNNKAPWVIQTVKSWFLETLK